MPHFYIGDKVWCHAKYGTSYEPAEITGVEKRFLRPTMYAATVYGGLFAAGITWRCPGSKLTLRPEKPS